jgi:glycosyltransferase involved in cell wall biosynthesis
MTKTISVIIPHLNQPEALEKCLASVRAQTVAEEDYEVIVVDNGSKELPADICERFGAILLVESEPGPGPARNKGIAAASADLLAFIDADCVADGNWLAAAVSELSKPGTEVVGGDVRIAYANPESLTALEAYESVFAYRQREYIERKGFSGTGNLAMKKSACDAVGKFAGIGVAEDRDWGVRASAKGLKPRYVPEMIVFHPARRTIEELKTKWLRHIQHDFADFAASRGGVARWLVRAIAVALSPLRDVPMTFMSGRIEGALPKLKAAGLLVRIRLYRAWQMLRQPFVAGSERAPQWNDAGVGRRPLK